MQFNNIINSETGIYSENKKLYYFHCYDNNYFKKSKKIFCEFSQNYVDNLINEITNSRSKWFYYPNISDEFCYNEVKINKIIYYPFITELNISVQIKFFNINSSLPTIHKIDYIYYSDKILYSIIYFIVPLMLCYLYQFL